MAIPVTFKALTIIYIVDLMRNDHRLVISALEIISGILYLWVLLEIWLNVSQNTAGIFAPIIWGIGTIAAFNVLFSGLLILVLGWNEKLAATANYGVQVGGVALLAISAGFANLGTLPLEGGIGSPQGALTWVLITILAFGLGWLGANWEKMRSNG